MSLGSAYRAVAGVCSRVAGGTGSAYAVTAGWGGGGLERVPGDFSAVNFFSLSFQCLNRVLVTEHLYGSNSVTSS